MFPLDVCDWTHGGVELSGVCLAGTITTVDTNVCTNLIVSVSAECGLGKRKHNILESIEIHLNKRGHGH
jgi:hypothetical protein